MRFSLVNGTIIQEYNNADNLSFVVVNLAEEDNAISQMELEADRVQATANLEQGALVRFVLFNLKQGDRLLIVAHHLIIDTVSWRLLLEDLSTGYEQACADILIKFPAKTDSYQQWAKALQKYSTEQALQARDYWQQLAQAKVNNLLIDINTNESNLVADSHTLEFSLSQEQTNSLLTDVHRVYHTEINDILLASVAIALYAWSGNENFLIDLEGHGRVDDIDGIDVSRTVGWFTSIYPVLLTIAPGADLPYQIKVSAQ
ncbi:MAG: hypothetical protein KME64_34125 [Scytonematopsis contorta HA4267-MV1]|nr:hypothetical protein [Scytonematopsis contorta HA4267-MV1]